MSKMTTLIMVKRLIKTIPFLPKKTQQINPNVVAAVARLNTSLESASVCPAASNVDWPKAIASK